MNCPRCECHIADGFYCIRCGYVPTLIDAKTRTDASTVDISIPQILRGILKAPSPDYVDSPDGSLNLLFSH